MSTFRRDIAPVFGLFCEMQKRMKTGAISRLKVDIDLAQYVPKGTRKGYVS
jgi:hypothetical protein